MVLTEDGPIQVFGTDPGRMQLADPGSQPRQSGTAGPAMQVAGPGLQPKAGTPSASCGRPGSSSSGSDSGSDSGTTGSSDSPSSLSHGVLDDMPLSGDMIGPAISAFMDPPQPEPTAQLATASESLTPLQLDTIMAQDDAAVAERLAIPISLAADLLRLFEWRDTRLYDAVSTSTDAQTFCKHQGFLLGPHAGPTSSRQCPICFSDMQPEHFNSLGCPHFYCLGCWAQYLRTAITESAAALRLKCPDPKCSARVGGAFLARHLTASQKEHMHMYIVNAYVLAQPHIQWCPGPRCSRAVRIPSGTQPRHARTGISCVCGIRFCFACQRAPHPPVSCAHQAAWTDRVEGDSISSKYLSARTKRCPHCRASIEKSGGCNHIHCTKCDYHFCWLCLQDWSVHGYGGCTAYRASEDPHRPDALDRIALARYLHYFERWDAHRIAMRYDNDFRAEVTAMCDQYRQATGDWCPPLYLRNAASEMLRARRVAQSGYIYVYFLRAGPARIVFEQRLNRLEQVTEELAEVYQLNRRTPEIMDRTRVQALAEAQARYRESLLDGVTGIADESAFFRPDELAVDRPASTNEPNPHGPGEQAT